MEIHWELWSKEGVVYIDTVKKPFIRCALSNGVIIYCRPVNVIVVSPVN